MGSTINQLNAELGDHLPRPITHREDNGSPPACSGIAIILTGRAIQFDDERVLIVQKFPSTSSKMTLLFTFFLDFPIGIQ